MSAKAPGAGEGGESDGQRPTMEPDSEIKLVVESQEARLLLNAKLGFRAGLFTCVWDSHVRF